MKQSTVVVIAAALGGILALARARGLDADWLFIGSAVGANVGLGLYAVVSGKVSFAGKSGPFRTYTGSTARVLGIVMVLAGVGFSLLYASAH